jgi:hypothetical protein
LISVKPINRAGAKLRRNSAARVALQYATVLAIAIALGGCGGGGSGTESTSQPIPITCVAGESNDVVLAWDMVSGAAGYRVFYSTSREAWLGNVKDAGGTPTTIISGLTSGTTYYFVAAAYDGAGTGGQLSNVVCVDIP